MNVTEITNKLENAGFEVNFDYPFVVVSLTNRSVTTGEIKAVFNHAITNNIIRMGNNVLIQA